jgi:hypothetical protein
MIHIKTAHKLLDFIYPTFVEEDGVVRLGFAFPPQKPSSEEQQEEISPVARKDFIELEAFINHTHIIDHFRHGFGLDGENPEGKYYDSNHSDFRLACDFAKKVAHIWAHKLKYEFPQYRFRVYYTQNDNPIVRFHRVREGEANWLNEESWAKEIAEGTIVILDTARLPLVRTFAPGP